MSTSPTLFSQNSWKIKLNNKLLLSASQESETANSKRISPADWKKNGNLELTYKVVEERGKWKRSFLFYDESDNQLLTKENTLHVKIPLSLLRKLFSDKKELRIYTVVSPVDPHIAVRIRRVHLCTLQLQ
jgi:hypothetical protein